MPRIAYRPPFADASECRVADTAVHTQPSDCKSSQSSRLQLCYGIPPPMPHMPTVQRVAAAPLSHQPTPQPQLAIHCPIQLLRKTSCEPQACTTPAAPYSLFHYATALRRSCLLLRPLPLVHVMLSGSLHTVPPDSRPGKGLATRWPTAKTACTWPQNCPQGFPTRPRTPPRLACGQHGPYSGSFSWCRNSIFPVKVASSSLRSMVMTRGSRSPAP